MLVTGKTSTTKSVLGSTPSNTESWRRVVVVPRGAASTNSDTLRNFSGNDGTTVLCGGYNAGQEEEESILLLSPAQEMFPQENSLPLITGLPPLRLDPMIVPVGSVN